MSSAISAIVISFFVACVSLFVQSDASGYGALAAGEPITLSTATPKQGQTLKVSVVLPSASQPPLVAFDKKTYKLFPVGQAADNVTYRALVGINALEKTGKHKLRVGESETAITVMPGGFGVQRLTLPSSKNNFISSPGEEETVAAAKKTVSSEQLWTGQFQRPSKARTSSQFGLRRIVNGKLLSDYFHSGLDFAGATGSPVVAPEKGKVLIARTGWRLHGGTVALDHGQGVITFYIHLSKLNVKEGDVVEAGQVIGKIGSTGRASGPHLHYSMYVNGDATNPLDWFAKTF